MKLLELRSPGTTVELHPRLAVVHASEPARRALVDALNAALRGGHQAAGFVEVHGIILDLDRETLGLLDLDGAVELVLAAADVPVDAMGLATPADDPVGQRDLSGERERMEAASESAATAHAALRAATEERHAIAARVADSEQVLEEAVASREAAERAVESASEALEEVEQNALDEIVDDDVADRLAEQGVADVVAHDGVARFDAPDVEVLEDHEAAWHAEEERATAARDALLAAEAAVADARDEVDRAARAANPARLGPADRADLEAAHEAVNQADERAERRFGGNAARRKLDEAKAVERAVLDRLGLDSYSDFLLRSSMGATDPSAELRLEIARTDLLRAETELAEARAVAAATPAPAPRPTPVPEPAPQPVAAAAPQLNEQPEPWGATISETVAESGEAARRRERAQEAGTRLNAATRARDEALAAESAARSDLDRVGAELVDAEAKLVEVAVRHDEAEQRLAQARMRADADRNGAHPTTRLDAGPGANTAGRGAALDELDRHLLAWLAARGQHALADPLPLVLDDVYQHVSAAELDPLLDRLDHLADSLHVVYLTDDQRILRWGAGLPPDRGGLSELTGAGSPTSE